MNESGRSGLLPTDDAPLSETKNSDTVMFRFAKSGEEPKANTFGDRRLNDMPVTASHGPVYDRLSDGAYGWLNRKDQASIVRIPQVA
ncbi:MAG: hypothetical protein WA948_03840 [Pontixanthobacter sp.]